MRVSVRRAESTTGSLKAWTPIANRLNTGHRGASVVQRGRAATCEVAKVVALRLSAPIPAEMPTATFSVQWIINAAGDA